MKQRHHRPCPPSSWSWSSTCRPRAAPVPPGGQSWFSPSCSPAVTFQRAQLYPSFTPLLQCHPDGITITSRRNTWFVRMPRGCSSDQTRVMVGLSGWSAFSGVYLFLIIALPQAVTVNIPESRHGGQTALHLTGIRGQRSPESQPTLRFVTVLAPMPADLAFRRVKCQTWHSPDVAN